MRKFTFALIAAIAFLGISGAEEQKKVGAVGALPPLPIDKVFNDADTEGDVLKSIVKDETFKAAVKAAIAAKKKAEEDKKKNPKLLSSTPAQAARIAFLEALQK